MVKHNNVVPNQHFHKKWQRRVKTWFHQPVQKKIRREKRQVKAAAMAPRPASGNLRPLVHCPTQKYNAKVKLGRGFSLAELKAAGLNQKYAQTVGIAVDHRRTNKCEESLKLNTERLLNYKQRLVVFPRHQKAPKKGDASKAEIADATQLKGPVGLPVAAEPAVTFTTVTEEMKAARGYATIRAARTEKHLVGIRMKMKKAAAEKIEN